LQLAVLVLGLAKQLLRSVFYREATSQLQFISFCLGDRVGCENSAEPPHGMSPSLPTAARVHHVTWRLTGRGRWRSARNSPLWHAVNLRLPLTCINAHYPQTLFLLGTAQCELRGMQTMFSSVDGGQGNWDKERGQNKDKPDNSAIMQPIAHDLTEAQIRAVAAYVSQLE
jgi:hypothetical protein